MITTIIDDKHKEHKIVTQQYQIGTYVIIDNDPAQQFSTNASEIEFHKLIRERYKFNLNESTAL